MVCMGADCAGLIPQRARRSWERAGSLGPGSGGAICAARRAPRHGLQQPDRGDMAIKPTVSIFVPAD